jgi:hypothetical protein
MARSLQIGGVTLFAGKELSPMRTIAIFAILFAAFPAPSRADQYVNGGHVVHTRLAPVVAHRVLPPFKGVHVYAGRNARR